MTKKYIEQLQKIKSDVVDHLEKVANDRQLLVAESNPAEKLTTLIDWIDRSIEDAKDEETLI